MTLLPRWTSAIACVFLTTAALDAGGWAVITVVRTPDTVVAGAPFDDTVRLNAGSVYGYDVPLPVMELGSQIPEPSQPLDRMGTFPILGPTVNPPDAAFWHVPSQKLFAVKPGSVLVSWKLAGADGTNNWEAAVVWPTNTARFQTHIAGPTPVDLSDAGKDSAAGKPTYPSVFGLEESRRLAAGCVDHALSILSDAGLGGHLPVIARWVAGRTN
jgi:hypothetical protein